MARTGLHRFVLAALLAAGTARAEKAPPPPPAPLSHTTLLRLMRKDPARLAALVSPAASGAERVAPRTASGSPWKSVAHAALPNPGAMIQLSDGTVLVQDQGTNNAGSGDWWKFTPDNTGSYQNGSWTQLASMGKKYAPLYFASAVLPNGKVIVEGGEYNSGNLVWTNKGALYDPVANTWTNVAPPEGGTGQWVRIGDGPSVVLEGGTFMMGASGYSGTTVQALFNPNSLTWTGTGTGKADGNGEEGWSLMRGGDVLTVDTGDTSAPLNSELYTPATGAWTSAGNTPAALESGGEIGPQVTRPNGTVFSVGATGHNAVYDTTTGAWSAAPDFPVLGGNQFDEADGPAAVLPNGKVLLMASPGEYNTPSHFYLFDGTTLTATTDTPNASTLSSYYGFMLVLPTGQVLFNDRTGNLWVYTAKGTPLASAAPVISKVPTTLAPNTTYTLRGTQLGSRSQGAAYGDDYQSATNYPLVRLVNNATGHVAYARTSGWTGVGVTPNIPGTTKFLVPAGIETGPSMLYVVANGVASLPKAVTIGP